MHLIVPFANVADEGARDALRTLDWRALARYAPGARLDGDAHSLTPPHERAYAEAIGLPGSDGALPLAAIGAGDDAIDVGANAVARLTPTHWQLGVDHARLVDPEQLELDADESRALFDAVCPLFEGEGIVLHWGAPLRWYALHGRFDGLACASIDRAIGRAIEPWLPVAREARFVRRLQNEAQMLWHEHRVNRARETRGQLPVNSFWIDGCGRSRTVRRDGVRLDTTLRTSALAADWSAWANAWKLLLLGPSSAAEVVTLCGEHGAQRLQRRGGAWLRTLLPASEPPAWLTTL